MDILPVSIGAASLTAFLAILFTMKRKKRMIGESVAVEYFDKNETFANTLPITGTITRQEKIEGQLLTVIELSKQINYRNFNYDELFVKERYEHERIKHNSESHAFVFLPIQGLHVKPSKFNQFDMVAWATVRHTDVEQN